MDPTGTVWRFGGIGGEVESCNRALSDIEVVAIDYAGKDLQRYAKGDERVIKEGDRAPDFTTVDHTGKRVSLSDLRGKKVWLWFYSSPGGGN